MKPSRALPQIGAPARIRHFSGESESVTIVEVRERALHRRRQRRGARREFTLRRGNASFIDRGFQHSSAWSLAGDRHGRRSRAARRRPPVRGRPRVVELQRDRGLEAGPPDRADGHQRAGESPSSSSQRTTSVAPFQLA